MERAYFWDVMGAAQALLFVAEGKLRCSVIHQNQNALRVDALIQALLNKMRQCGGFARAGNGDNFCVSVIVPNDGLLFFCELQMMSELVRTAVILTSPPGI